MMGAILCVLIRGICGTTGQEMPAWVKKSIDVSWPKEACMASTVSFGCYRSSAILRTNVCLSRWTSKAAGPLSAIFDKIRNGSFGLSNGDKRTFVHWDCQRLPSTRSRHLFSYHHT